MDRHQAIGSYSSVERLTGQKIATNVENAVPGDNVRDGREG